MPIRFSALSLILALSTLSAAQAASNYDFVAAPQIDINRIYRVDRVTGEMGACQYGIAKEGSVGVTICYRAGEGATAQVPGEYAVMASHHERESGVFRVEMRTGAVSVCYVLNDTVVCTASGR